MHLLQAEEFIASGLHLIVQVFDSAILVTECHERVLLWGVLVGGAAHHRQQGRYSAVDRVRILWAEMFLQRARHKWRRAQKILLQRTTGKSHIGELAPMALCDTSGVFVMTTYRALIRLSGEDAMGRSCILDSHPGRWMPAAVHDVD